MTSIQIFGALATLMMLFSRIAYFTSIFKGETRPHAFSWLIWGAISGIGFAAQWAEGAGPGAWARGFGAATCFLLFIFGLTHGEKRITRGDWITLVSALAAIPIWVLTKTPFWSVILVCCIDTVGYLPTVRKVWTKPFEELPTGYFFSSAGAFLSLLAIEIYTPSTWLYSALLWLTNGMMGIYIILRRRALTQQRAVAEA